MKSKSNLLDNINSYHACSILDLAMPVLCYLPALLSNPQSPWLSRLETSDSRPIVLTVNLCCVPDQEFQKLKRGMESLLASNDEKVRGAGTTHHMHRSMSFLHRWLIVLFVCCCCRVFMGQDRHIEELTTLLGHYRKGKEVAALPQGDTTTPVSAVLMG